MPSTRRILIPIPITCYEYAMPCQWCARRPASSLASIQIRISAQRAPNCPAGPSAPRPDAHMHCTREQREKSRERVLYIYCTSTSISTWQEMVGVHASARTCSAMNIGEAFRARASCTSSSLWLCFRFAYHWLKSTGACACASSSRVSESIMNMHDIKCD